MAGVMYPFHSPLGTRKGGGGGRALLEGRGEVGRGSKGGREGVQWGDPPPAGMNHINQELQKCTTLTHSAYTVVIMSEHMY